MIYKLLDKEIKKVNELHYQGATRVAQALLNAYLNFGLKLNINDKRNNRRIMKAAREYIIKESRPTEPLAHNGLKYVWEKYREQATKLMLKKSTENFLNAISRSAQEISKQGNDIINTGDNIYTHCHSSTVGKLLVRTFKRKKFQVFNSETRPLFQGRITAKKLRANNIPVTLIVDSAAPFVISKTSGNALNMDAVILGADLIFPDGSAVNKIGSYGIALAAYYNNVPVYIAASLLKYDKSLKIKLERRPAREVWSAAPKGLKIVNFAFDVIPPAFIQGIVCEYGVIKTKEVEKYAKKLFNNI